MNFFFLSCEKEHPSLSEIVVKKVPMNDFVEVEIPASDLKTHLIHTVGRIGCDAALLHATALDKTEQVVVTHYDRDNLSLHLGLIVARSLEHPKDQRRATLVTWFEEGDRCQELLVNFLTQYASEKPDIIVAHLNMDQATGVAKLADPFQYQLSFVKGFGGDPDVHQVSVEGTGYRKRF